MKQGNSAISSILFGILIITAGIAFWQWDQAYREKEREQNARIIRLEQMIQSLHHTVRQQSEHTHYTRLTADSVVVKRLTLTDKQGREAFAVGTSSDKTYLRMSGGDNRANQVLLTVFNKGNKALLFRNEEFKNRIGIATAADGTPFIDLTEDGMYRLTSDRGFTLGEFFESDGEMGLRFRSDDSARKELWAVIEEDPSAQSEWPMAPETEAQLLKQDTSEQEGLPASPARSDSIEQDAGNPKRQPAPSGNQSLER